MGGMGGAILEKSWEIQNTNIQKGYRGGMMCHKKNHPLTVVRHSEPIQKYNKIHGTKL